MLQYFLSWTRLLVFFILHKEQREKQRTDYKVNRISLFSPSSLRSLYWPAGFYRHTRCSSLPAALLLFIDVLRFKVNVLTIHSVFTLPKNNPVTNLCRQLLNTFVDKRTSCHAGHTASLKTFIFYILIRYAASLQIRIFYTTLVSGWGRVSHIWWVY